MNTANTDEEQIFGIARQILAPDERDRYVCEVCRCNPQLEHRIRKLLEVHLEDKQFLASPVETSPAINVLYEMPEQAGTIIGNYQLIEQIGAGGMGLVFLAQQTAPVRRRVALKIIQPGMDSYEVVRRFEAERQSLALLNHPGISRLLDAGTTDSGRPFFVMELTQGEAITQFCRQYSLPLKERLKLFEEVCDAVEHAHQNGVIHRDLKPSNIVITMLDGRKVPKVIDFGIASAIRLTPASEFVVQTPEPQTASSIVGTPAYMSPEQVQLPDQHLDARADVYALGVVLYELLTDTNPFSEISWKQLTFTQIQQTIQDKSPQLPSQRAADALWETPQTKSTSNTNTADSALTSAELSEHKGSPRQTSRARASLLKGDLDWIIMKALENDRERRYASAAALADDLRRFLHHQPVKAGPPTKLYRIRKYVRRHRARILMAAMAAGMVGLSCIALGIGWSLLLHRVELAHQHQFANRQQELVRERNQAVLERTYATDLRNAWDFYQFGNAEGAKACLQRYADIAPSNAVTGFEWHYLNRLCKDAFRELDGSTGYAFDLKFSPDGGWIVSCVGNESHRLDIWDVTSGKLAHSITDFRDDVNFACFSHDGSRLLTAEEIGQVRTWEASTWKEVQRVDGFLLPVGQIFLGSDDRTLIATEVRWSPPPLTRTVIRNMRDNSSVNVRSIDGARLLDVHQGRNLVLVSTDDGKISVRTFPDLQIVSVMSGVLPEVCCGRFSSGGDLVAVGTRLGLAGLWRWSDWIGGVLPSRTADPMAVRGLAFSPDEQFLTTCSHDGFVEVWDVPSRSQHRLFRAKTGECWSVDVAPNSQHLAVGEIHGIIRVHDWGEIVSHRLRIIESKSKVHATAVDPAVAKIAIISSDQTQITLYSTLDGHVGPSFSNADQTLFQGLAFAADGKSLWVTDTVGSLLNIDVGSMSVTRRLPMYRRTLTSPQLSHDGQLAGVSTLDTVDSLSAIWDLISEREVLRLPKTLTEGDPGAVRVAGFADELCVFVSQSNDITRMNFLTGAELSPRFRHQRHWITLILPFPSAREKTCAVGLLDGTVHLWRPDTGTDDVLQGHRRPVSVVAVSADAKTLASGDYDGEIRLWHVSTRQQLCVLTGLTGQVIGLWFTPDGRRLVAAANTPSGGSEVMIWDASNP